MKLLIKVLLFICGLVFLWNAFVWKNISAGYSILDLGLAMLFFAPFLMEVNHDRPEEV